MWAIYYHDGMVIVDREFDTMDDLLQHIRNNFDGCRLIIEDIDAYKPLKDAGVLTDRDFMTHMREHHNIGIYPTDANIIAHLREPPTIN